MLRLPHVVLIAAALFFFYDLVADFAAIMHSESDGHVETGDSIPHFIIEAIIFIATLIALTQEILNSHRAKAALRASEQQITRFSDGLVQQVEQQFEQWKLSPSESEIAWLIIKGFSFSDIATLRNVKEKTVRQQATAIYAKSGVSNRAELTAYFLEDFLSLASK